MLYPNPPHLECGFYFHDISEADALAQMTDYLTSRKVAFTGRIVAAFDHNIRSRVVRWEPAWLEDERTDAVKSLDIDVTALVEYVRDESVKVIQIEMRSALGISTKREVLGYCPLPRMFLGNHAIEILADGQAFTGYGGETNTSEARRLGRRTYEWFLATARDLAPSYATITVEKPIPIPAQLGKIESSTVFTDFYISNAYVGESGVTRIKSIYTSAYIEIVGDGVYISCYEYFNPNRVAVEYNICREWSKEAARLIAKGATR